jgi:sulfatase maturation enzyme AslB (radical SAM superfamily)
MYSNFIIKKTPFSRYIYPTRDSIIQNCSTPIPELLDEMLKKSSNILDTPGLKIVTHPGYNYIFSEKTGEFARCGATLDEDPQYSPLGPEIADIEISTICSGINGSPCAWCYKSNTMDGENMSLSLFQQVFAKFPENLTQIAFGIGDIDGNPEIKSILKWCRENNLNRVVIPNITINGSRLTSAWVEFLSQTCGAVAISRYSPKEICYTAVEQLASEINKEDRTLQQVNIHQLLAVETFNACMETLHDIQTHPQLAKLNAIVFLGLKPKGNRNKMHPLLDQEKFSELVQYALKNHLRIGFDSCSANSFLKSIQNHPFHSDLAAMVEPCESMGFSIYVNVKGKIFPCSFLEGEKGYKGVDLFHCENFLDEIWNGKTATEFRLKLQEKKRSCPHFQI